MSNEFQNFQNIVCDIADNNSQNIRLSCEMSNTNESITINTKRWIGADNKVFIEYIPTHPIISAIRAHVGQKDTELPIRIDQQQKLIELYREDTTIRYDVAMYKDRVYPKIGMRKSRLK